MLNRVRELAPGERPGDWLGAELAALATAPVCGSVDQACDAAEPACDAAEQACDAAEQACDAAEQACDAAEQACDAAGPARERVEPARQAARVAGAQRYEVQFTATAEYVDLVKRAQALLSGSEAGAALAEVHLRAMRELPRAEPISSPPRCILEQHGAHLARAVGRRAQGATGQSVASGPQLLSRLRAAFGLPDA